MNKKVAAGFLFFAFGVAAIVGTKLTSLDIPATLGVAKALAGQTPAPSQAQEETIKTPSGTSLPKYQELRK